MKKYSFRLQPVLNLKEKALEDKRLEMAKVIKLLNDYQSELQALEETYLSYKNTAVELSESEEVINITELASYNSYMIELEQKIKDKKVTIENTRKVLKIKQDEVNEAYKDVKVLEKLKETQSKKFYDAIYKKEAEEVDDIVTARYKLQEV
ncbi:flagellar export protein FliJ [bacterium]|nr:flagellar export protein FliJ [bacterium]